MIENSLRNGRLIEFAIVAPAVDVIADKLSHRGTRDHVAREMAARTDSSDNHRGGQAIRNDWDDSRVRILMSYHGGQRPSANCMS